MKNISYLKYKKRKKVAVLFFFFIAVLMIFGTIIILGHNQKDRKYKEYLQKAQQYYDNYHYEAAIMTYHIAINARPDKEEPYMMIADIYLEQGDYVNAREVLSMGYKSTGSVAFLKTLERIYVFDNSGNDKYISDENSIEEVVTINNNIIIAVANNSYSQYIQEYGNADIVLLDDNILAVYHQGFEGVCYYYNTPSNGYIVDETSGKPYENRKPNHVSVDNMSSLFHNYHSLVSYSRLQELFGDSVGFSYNQTDQRYEVAYIYNNCIVRIECSNTGDVSGTRVWNQIEPQYKDGNAGEMNNEDTGQSGGYITSSLTGLGVKAALCVRASNDRYGAIIIKTESGYDGSYALELLAGEYNVEITANGFISEHFTIHIRKGEVIRNNNYTISPVLQEGEIRIVLEWGSSPRDLDSYLIGASSSGNNVNINYQNLQAITAGNVIAELDLDDTDGYGPETITIYDTGGQYEYSVHDFTNMNNNESSAIGSSGAAVKVYREGQGPIVFNVPYGIGTWWTVFRIEEGEIITVNQMK